MTSYFRIMLGRQSVHANECFKGGFIGTDYGINQDLSGDLSENWRDFNKQFISLFLANHPEKSRVAGGLACGMLWTVSKGLQKSDIVMCPDGLGAYHLGVVDGAYYHESDGVLPHRLLICTLH